MSDAYDDHKVLAFDQARWIDHAACAGTDVDLFFPQRGESTKAAKAVCAGCPVRAECLDYALRLPERFGIFGGLSEKERRRIRIARAQHLRVVS